MRHQAKTQGFWGWVVLGLCALAVLAGGVGAAVDGALLGIAALTLQKQFLTFTAAQSAHRTGISSHIGCTS